MIGETISHYKILEVIGEGGMGVVYKAQDTRLDRTVALKFLPPDLTRNSEARERFIHEAKAASALQHPNICTIHDIDETTDKQLFIVMDCYEGQTLAKMIERGPLSVEQAVDIAVQVAQGLQKAHEQGIVHRDMKPGNIIITGDGTAKILDFGLVKLSGQTIVTKIGSTVGTVAYMSPEQAQGKMVDHRTDIWSLGIVLYEMLTGERPFQSDYEQALVYSILNDEPNAVRALRNEVPFELERIVAKAMQKSLAERYANIEELLKDLSKFQSVRGVVVTPLSMIYRSVKRPMIAIPMVLFLFGLSWALVWYIDRDAKIRWAHEKALPEIIRLADTMQYTLALRLAQRASEFIPDNTQLQEQLIRVSRWLCVQTTPPGAQVWIRKYRDTTSEWSFLGMTPIESSRVPRGVQRWKISRSGYETIAGAFGATSMRDKDTLSCLLDTIGVIPPGMVRVEGYGPLNDFFMDKYEVTNREYKIFVDGGGYRNPAYWKYPFVSDGRAFTWQEGMKQLVDMTGRPGPATWYLGDYPEGTADNPVTGVSWHEAAAYAAFVGKSLPTVTHWQRGAGQENAGFMIPLSNFGGIGAAAVGTHQGISQFGLYDMAGNAKEWCWNDIRGMRAVCGGGWTDPDYMFNTVDPRPPLTREKTFGFRCVRYIDERLISPSVFEATSGKNPFDITQARPCGDKEFGIYKRFFSYTKTVLDPRVEQRVETSADYIRERVSFSAANSNERIVAYLFLPRHGKKPYQTVIFLPGQGAWRLSSFEDYGDRRSPNAHTKSGRAFVFPMWWGTFERKGPLTPLKGSNQSRDLYYNLSKDLGRTIDYLETRSDFDTKKIALIELSSAGTLVIIGAVEPRVRAMVLNSGGIMPDMPAEVNPVNFAPRVKVPFLFIGGEYDPDFPVATNQKVLFKLLGTPVAEKSFVLFKAGHDVYSDPRGMRATLDFLDKYFGPTQ